MQLQQARLKLSSHLQDFDPEFGSVKIGSSSRGRGGAVSEAVAGARRPGRRERKFTSDEIKKFIEDAEGFCLKLIDSIRLN